MLKTLLKKQLQGLIAGLANRKGQKKQTATLYLVILGFVALMVGFMFFGVFTLLCEPLLANNLGWLYFVYAGLMALAISVIMSVFMAQSQLYEAKDNNLLLALPIPSKYILFVRMTSLYLQNLFLSLCVFIPAIIVYVMTTTASIGQVIIWLLMIVTQPFLSLFVSCLLGFLLALITSKMRNKTFLNVALSIIFLIVYFIVYAKMMDYVNILIVNSQSIGSSIKSFAYPIYKFGTACMGDFVGCIIVIAIIGAMFGLLYLLLDKTYIKLITSNHSAAKAKYNGKIQKAKSPLRALLKKECSHFFHSSVYLLNCGLGSILLVIIAILAVVKSTAITQLLTQFEELKIIAPLVACLAICMTASMDAVTAPSISLEGKHFWILQSLPVDMWTVLKSKLALHYLVTAPIATLTAVVFAIILKTSWLMTILLLLLPSVSVLLFGVFGLLYNLKKPVMKWDSETFVIKQSISVLFTILTIFAIFAGLVALYFATRKIFSPELFLVLCLALLAGITLIITYWLKNKGTKILANLS